MKKLIIFILSLIYITTSTGVMLNKHYCMGEIIDWTLTSDTDGNCSGCGMSELDTNSCCNDEQKFFKIDNDQNTVVSEYQVPVTTVDFTLTDFLVLTPTYLSSLKGTTKWYNDRRSWQTLPLFIINSEFLI